MVLEAFIKFQSSFNLFQKSIEIIDKQLQVQTFNILLKVFNIHFYLIVSLLIILLFLENILKVCNLKNYITFAPIVIIPIMN